MEEPDTPSKTHLVGVGVALSLGVTALALLNFGQPWWCECASFHPWSSEIHSRHNSQHLFDAYSFTHYEHGLLLFLLFSVVLGQRWSAPAKFGLAVGFECLWEIFENTPWTLARYRQNTIALDYYGDSIVNSIGDVLCCALGYGAAAWGGLWITLASLFFIELSLILAVRDSLLLNIVQLIAPNEALRQWQQPSP